MKVLDAIRKRLLVLRRIELAQGTVLEFKKSRTYVIAFDNTFITKDECQALSKILHNKGVTNVTCVLGRGDPVNSIVVMENDK